MTEPKEQLFFVGVKAIIQNQDGDVLVLLADTSTFQDNTQPYWDIPGGRIEHGDSEIETLQKELQEEIGNKATQYYLLDTVFSQHQIPYGGGNKAGLLLRVWGVVLDDDAEIVISDEHTEFRWVQPKIAAEYLANKYPTDFCEKVSQLTLK